MSQEKFTQETVLWVKRWASNLFSFGLTRPAHFRFEAGQWARLGFYCTQSLNATDSQPSNTLHTNEASPSAASTLFRAYSIVSSPYDDTLEFFSIVVPDGAFTSQLQHLKEGDSLLLEKLPFGFLTLSRFQQPLPNDLWLLATGTGLAPFLSVLKDYKTWDIYQKVVLVYSVRYSHELAYQQKIAQLAEDMQIDANSFVYVPIVTRSNESALNSNQSNTINTLLNQRLPQLIANRKLEAHVGINLNASSSHIMLCGNPQMVDDTRHSLIQRGLSMNRRGVGNIAVENYW